jgi:hypothetical protein
LVDEAVRSVAVVDLCTARRSDTLCRGLESPTERDARSLSLSLRRRLSLPSTDLASAQWSASARARRRPSSTSPSATTAVRSPELTRWPSSTPLVKRRALLLLFRGARLLIAASLPLTCPCRLLPDTPEREFEDEKGACLLLSAAVSPASVRELTSPPARHAVLMLHQKAKHFKCRLCPRKLNTVRRSHRLSAIRY